MTKSTPTDPELQLKRYRAAVDAVGGVRAHAKMLGFSDRHGARLYSGGSPLHEGILHDTSRALLAHADLCRALERKLSPLLSSNLTADQLAQQAQPDMRGRKADSARFLKECQDLDAALKSQKIRKPGTNAEDPTDG